MKSAARGSVCFACLTIATQKLISSTYTNVKIHSQCVEHRAAAELLSSFAVMMFPLQLWLIDFCCFSIAFANTRLCSRMPLQRSQSHSAPETFLRDLCFCACDVDHLCLDRLFIRNCSSLAKAASSNCHSQSPTRTYRPRSRAYR